MALKNWLAYMDYLIVSMTIHYLGYSLPCVSFKDHILNAVHKNYEIVASNYNWSQLAFLEAFYVRNFRPSDKADLKPLETDRPVSLIT